MIEITTCPHGVNLTERPCAFCDRKSEVAALRARVAALEGALESMLYWGSAVFDPEGRYKHAMHKANVEPDIIFDRWMDDVDELRVACAMARGAVGDSSKVQPNAANDSKETP